MDILHYLTFHLLKYLSLFDALFVCPKRKWFDRSMIIASVGCTIYGIITFDLGITLVGMCLFIGMITASCLVVEHKGAEENKVPC